MTKSKEVAVKDESNEMSFATETPDYVKSGTNLGSEDVGMEDMTIPRLSMIQDLSPQHKKSKDEYIEGAEAGMVFNTVTGQLFSEALYVVPVYYIKEFVIWKDQNKGGGFRGAFHTELEAEQERATLDDASDCEVVDTAQHYVLVVSKKNGEWKTEQAVISMSKSQMKVNRAWNSQIRLAGGDRFSHVYSLSVITDQNAAGQEYYNWKVKGAGYAPKTVYDEALEMYHQIKNGEKTVNREDKSEAKGSGLTDSDLDNM